jgi:excisionase family DNA binding protein
MEKISIVRRRQKGPKEPGDGQSLDSDLQAMPAQELMEIPTSILKQSEGNTDERAAVSEGFAGDKEGEMSVKLTPEQYKLVESSQYVKYFLNGEANGVSLDVQKHPDGQIVFNFQFKKADTVRMLKAEHVCQMLQISKSLLMKLVKAQKIKSYKIGRLRRFLLEDIISYLAKSEEVFDYRDAEVSQEDRNDVL